MPRRFSQILWSLSAASWLAIGLYTEFVIGGRAPRQPDPSSGTVVPVRVHDWIAYMSLWHARWYEWGMYLSFLALVLIGGILELVTRKRSA